MQNQLIRIFFSVLTALLLATSNSCTIGQTENASMTEEYFFTFEPSSTLERVLLDSPDIFTAIKTEPDLQPVSQAYGVSWKQSDYLILADYLHKNIWNETLENWQMTEMYFSLGCKQTDLGLQYGQFKFFQIKKNNDVKTRVVHILEVDPGRKFAHAMGIEYSPILENWDVIDLPAINISASDALEIAETNGGFQGRTSAQNECGVSVAISSTNENEWLVIYSPDVFIDSINVVTGE